jgi:Tfp pilus assembly protein PilF
MRSWQAALILPFAAVALGGAGVPSGSQTHLGNVRAQTCEAHAKLAADRKMSPATAVETCSEALAVEFLDTSDRAATLNNRGVVLFAMMGESASALADFNAASQVAPRRGESYINRGGVLIQQRRYDEAIQELDKGLERGNLQQPWKAHYNRALAREAVGDLRGARDDFARALELKPGWDMAAEELARFSVQPRR